MGAACCRNGEDPRKPSFSDVLNGEVADLSGWVSELKFQPCCISLLGPGSLPAGPTDSEHSGRGAETKGGRARGKGHSGVLVQLEDQMQELFRLHDLNGNGFLEEEELVQLNTKVAMLHYGKETDLFAVKAKYRTLFREKLDPFGRPVPYSVFRAYVMQVLDALDPDPLAQEMIVEQFTAEARSARAVFHLPSFASHSDQALVSKISFTSVTSGPCSTLGTASSIGTATSSQNSSILNSSIVPSGSLAPVVRYGGA